MVALPAPAAEIVPGGGLVLVAWFGPKRAPTRGAPTGFEIEARPFTNTCIYGTPHWLRSPDQSESGNKRSPLGGSKGHEIRRIHVIVHHRRIFAACYAVEAHS